MPCLATSLCFTKGMFPRRNVNCRSSCRVTQPGPSAYEHWYALAASLRAHQQRALVELEIGRLINQQSETILAGLGSIQSEFRRDGEAERLARAALAIQPTYRPARLLVGLIATKQGKYREAIEVLRSSAQPRNGI